jgi:hypothetical protein
MTRRPWRLCVLKTSWNPAISWYLRHKPTRAQTCHKVWIVRIYKHNKFLKEISIYFHCIHIRSFTVCHFGMIEIMGLENVTSRSSSTASSPYQILSKPNNPKVIKMFYCTHIRILNIFIWNGRSYRIEILMTRLSIMASTPYKISFKSTKRFKSYWEKNAHRPTDRWSYKPPFVFEWNWAKIIWLLWLVYITYIDESYICICNVCHDVRNKFPISTS